jgi:hypothetical protein
VCQAAGWSMGILNAIPRVMTEYGFASTDTESSDSIPFVEGPLPGQFCFVFGLFAIALGMRQSVGEWLHGTFPVLLHMPVSRTSLIFQKLSIGLAVYLFSAAIPIVLYGLWAATRGTHASPFYWSMTIPTWVDCLGMTVLYLAAFLSGLRPARWFGSRLAPLVAGVLPVLLTLSDPLSIWGQVMLVLLSDAVLVLCILQVARDRDYS